MFLEDHYMDLKLLLRSIVKNLLIFIIAVILVIGFYYHSHFYQLGLYGLIIVGGLITFIVIKIASWINSSPILQMYDGVILFEPQQTELVKSGAIEMIIKKARGGRIKKGDIIRAKVSLSSEHYFAELIVTGVYYKKLADITDEEAYLAGYRDKKHLKEEWIRKHGEWDEEEEVKIIKFKVI